jgi:two-component system chemotaxis response regulator CheB
VSHTPLGVMLIDDSSANRKLLTGLLETEPELRLLGAARGDEEGLALAIKLRPDVILLDLTVPRLGGFQLLRTLRTRMAVPVIVITSHAQPGDVFTALELGALEFIAKPSAIGSPESLATLRRELVEKVRSVRGVSRTPGPSRAAAAAISPGVVRPSRAATVRPFTVLALGASTGGPPAVEQVLNALAGQALAVLICQHMPAMFTKAFAERLHRMGAFAVSEAKEGDRVKPGQAYVAPGGQQMTLVSVGDSLRLAISRAPPADKHAPSVDVLFHSLAHVLGSAAFGVILTGMGSDGSEGAKDIQRAGGEVWAEAQSSAVIFGMPQAAISTGAVARVLKLEEIGPAVIDREKGVLTSAPR